METLGDVATVTIENTNNADATMMDLQIRGLPLIQADPIEIPNQDQDSIDAYGPSSIYPLPTFWLSTIRDVLSLQGFILSVYSQPAERLTGTWEAASDLDQATDRDLSDRIGVVRGALITNISLSPSAMAFLVRWGVSLHRHSRFPRRVSLATSYFGHRAGARHRHPGALR